MKSVHDLEKHTFTFFKCHLSSKSGKNGEYISEIRERRRTFWLIVMFKPGHSYHFLQDLFCPALITAFLSLDTSLCFCGGINKLCLLE